MYFILNIYLIFINKWCNKRRNWPNTLAWRTSHLKINKVIIIIIINYILYIKPPFEFFIMNLSLGTVTLELNWWHGFLIQTNCPRHVDKTRNFVFSLMSARLNFKDLVTNLFNSSYIKTCKTDLIWFDFILKIERIKPG